MDAIRIENLRSLTDTGFVKLKPLTLLVGQNSSGKSSFLRFFPLLRQSIEARTEGPISWYGRLVDFGSFQEALGRKSEKQEMSFHFRLTLEERFPIIGRDPNDITFDLNKQDIQLTLRLGRGKAEEGTLIKACLLSYADHQIKIEFDNSGKVRIFKVNAFDVLDNINEELFYETDYFLPNINVTESQGKHIIDFKDIEGRLFDSLNSEIAKHLSSRDDSDIHIPNTISTNSSERILEYIKVIPLWKPYVYDWTTEDNSFRSLKDRIITMSLVELLRGLDIHFKSFGLDIRYIAPVRATAERYYRLQNLALDEVDSRGENLAMFLKNLTSKERKDFGSWTEKHFSFILQAVPSGGHISLNMKDLNEGEEFNLADTGFGYSQILPILIQLWFLTKRTRRKRFRRETVRPRPIIFAIEQPELHLHPGLQAKLADVFIAAIEMAKAEEIDLRLIIETHSEVIVNRLGHRVANQDLNPEDVNVVMFEKEPSALSTKVSFSGYDENGFLIKWPPGFLEPDMI